MLEKTLDQIIDINIATRSPLQVEFDPAWRSPCEVGEPEEGAGRPATITWEPVRRNSFTDDFSGLERAIECPIHPDIKTYFAR